MIITAGLLPDRLRLPQRRQRLAPQARSRSCLCPDQSEFCPGGQGEVLVNGVKPGQAPRQVALDQRQPRQLQVDINGGRSRAELPEQRARTRQVPLGNVGVSALEQQATAIAQQLRLPEGVTVAPEDRQRAIRLSHRHGGCAGAPQHTDAKHLRARAVAGVQGRVRADRARAARAGIAPRDARSSASRRRARAVRRSGHGAPRSHGTPDGRDRASVAQLVLGEAQRVQSRDLCLPRAFQARPAQRPLREPTRRGRV